MRITVTGGIALVRTDAEPPKHKGLTMFFVRHGLAGHHGAPDQAALAAAVTSTRCSSTTCSCPTSSALGAVNEGWQVALTTLMNERMTLGASTTGIGFEEIFDARAARRQRGGRRSTRSTCGCALPIGTPGGPACASVFTAVSRRSRREAARAPKSSVGKLVGRQHHAGYCRLRARSARRARARAGGSR